MSTRGFPSRKSTHTLSTPVTKFSFREVLIIQGKDGPPAVPASSRVTKYCLSQRPAGRQLAVWLHIVGCVAGAQVTQVLQRMGRGGGISCGLRMDTLHLRAMLYLLQA